MSREVTLTIGIPTFNGATCLGDTLDNVMRELAASKKDVVEVVISNNASQDSTRDIAKSYADKNSSLVAYYENEQNVGFDRNVDLLVKRARGKFVWILSDDDHLKEGAVSKILEVIEAHPGIQAICVNYKSAISLDIRQDCLCKDGSDFFRKSKFKSGLISSNVINRNAWLAGDLSKYYDSGWIHFGFLVDSLTTGRGYIVSDEYIQQVGGGRWGSKGAFINVGLNLVSLFQNNMDPRLYDSDVRRMADMAVKAGYPRFIRRAKSRGFQVDVPLLRRFCKLYGKYVSFWLIDLPFLLAPMRLYRGVSSWNRSLKKGIKAVRCRFRRPCMM
jgi:abequosyltransferase